MKAILWKELRENIRWAVLAMGALGAALCYALYASPDSQPAYYSFTSDGITLCRKSYLLVTTFGCAAIGLLLGFLQIAPELKRDRWAALLHRPVPRSTIFWGKVLAGVLLYALATLPAFAFAVWQVATPGNFGVPFLPAMMKPGLADLGAGLVYYFAALAATLDRGRWIGRRAFPLLAAGHVSFLVTSSTFFREAVATAALMALALAIAAWGAIRHPDTFGARVWTARVALLAVLFFGALGLGDLARGFLTAAWPSPRTKALRYELTLEGLPIRLTTENNIVVEVASLDGQPLTDPNLQPDRVRNQTKSLNTVCSFVGDSHGWRPGPYQPKYREPSAYLIAENPYQYPRLEQWFHLTKERYYVCYLPITKQEVALWDNEGFQPETSSPKSFPPDVQMDNASTETRIVWDERKLQFVDLSSRKITDVPLPRPGPIFGVGYAWASHGQNNVSASGVALSDGMAVFTGKARLIAFLPYQRDVNLWGNIALGISGKLDRFYLWHQPSSWIEAAKRGTMPAYLDELDAEGRLVRTYELPPLPDFQRPTSFPTLLDRHLRSPAFIFGEMLYRKVGAALGSERLQNALANQFGKGWKTTRQIAIGSSSVSLILAGVALACARRAQLSWKQAASWAGFVLLFNLAGFLAFCLAADWPRLVACPACRRRRPVEKDFCPACRAEWPAVAAHGTEIFDKSQEVTA